MADQSTLIPAQGNAISMRLVSNLKHACFFICHRYRTHRVVIPVNILLPDIRSLRAQRLLEIFHENLAVLQIVEKNWPKTLEMILLFLGQSFGVKKSPMAYVVRTDLKPPALSDPTVGD